MIVFIYSFAALITGFILDMLLGDPHDFPHLVRCLGSLITTTERVTRRAKRFGGFLLVLVVALIFAGIPFLVLFISYRFFLPLGYIVESFLCYQLLAAKSLKTESMKVYHSLVSEDIEGARKNVSMIVGRDTASLDREGITRAAIETVAENTTDGVGAPLIFIMLGGAALGCLYKAVNTMDSMVGYKNDQYLHFGRFAAKTDDVFNYLPSRICALLMILATYILRFDGKNAFFIWRRDRRKHASPNSAQTESVLAGALGIRLAGPASYHGTICDKRYIGDDMRPVQVEDIVSANRLMYATAFLTLIFTLLFRACLFFLRWA